MLLSIEIFDNESELSPIGVIGEYVNNWSEVTWNFSNEILPQAAATPGRWSVINSLCFSLW